MSDDIEKTQEFLDWKVEETEVFDEWWNKFSRS